MAWFVLVNGSERSVRRSVSPDMGGYAVGPFRRKGAAQLLARYGGNNPHLFTVSQAERLYSLVLAHPSVVDGAIRRCAATLALRLGNVSIEGVFTIARARAAICPTRGWRKASFSEWGRCQLLTKQLCSLGAALDGAPSGRWLAAWLDFRDYFDTAEVL